MYVNVGCIRLLSSFLFCFFFLLIDSGMFSTSKQGNCLRFFELQSVSAAVMRTVLDKMPGSFQGKIKQYRESCRKSEKKKDFILRIYAFFYFNILQFPF